MKKINKGSIALALTLLLIFSINLLTAPGCKKKKPPPRPTPMPTATTVPHIEKIVYAYNGDLFWMNTDGSGKTEIFPDNNSKWYPSVSPDGWYVMYWVQTRDHYNLWVGDFKKRHSYQITFDEDSLEGDVQNFRINNAVSWTQDSNFVFYSRNKDIWKMTRDGFNQEAVTNSHRCISPSFSKNNKVVYAKLESKNTANLYIKDISLVSDEKITKYREKEAGSPCFSPDGAKLAFTVTDGDTVDIFMYNVGNKSEESMTHDGKSHSPSFSVDGSKIIYSSFVTDRYQPEIWIMKTDKSEKVKITKDGGVSPSWLYRILAEPMPTETPEPEKMPTREEMPVETYEEAPPPEATPIPEEIPYEEDDLSVRVVKQGDKLLFYPVIHFDSGYAGIKSEFYDVLDDMMKIVSKFSSPVYIEGHTDDVPIATAKFDSNYELSVARAQAVKDYLVTKHGVPASRITLDGLGPDRPIMPNNSAENRYKNRRAEIHLRIIKEEEAKAEAEAAGAMMQQEQEAPPQETAPEETVAEPTAVPTPIPTPPKKKSFLEKIFKKKPKKSKGAGW